MKRISIVLALVIPVLMFSINGQAQSSSVYSWTDENGVVHFSDRAPAPEEVPDVEILDPKAPPPASNDGNPYQEGNADSGSLNNTTTDGQDGDTTGELSYADQKRAEIQANREAADERNAERNRICLQARGDVAKLEPNRRVYYTDENGNTSRMDDVERSNAVEEAKRLVSEFCD